MKKETIGIIILAIVFCFGIGAMLKGRDWDYDRGEVKAQFQKDSVAKLSPYAIDSVTYDSNAHTLTIRLNNDSIAVYHIDDGGGIYTLPQIDWNWFKKGYRPEDWKSGVLKQGIYPLEEPTIRRLSFRDTINNSK